MEHIEVDGAPFNGIHDRLGQFFRVPSNNLISPAVEPTIPEFHTHERPLFAILIKEILHLSEIFAGLGTKIPCYQDVLFYQATRP